MGTKSHSSRQVNYAGCSVKTDSVTMTSSRTLMTHKFVLSDDSPYPLAQLIQSVRCRLMHDLRAGACECVLNCGLLALRQKQLDVKSH